MSSNLTESQKQFLSNVTQPRPTPPTDELREDLATRYTRYQNTRNIIDGANIANYHEYLQEKCDKLCLFKFIPEYAELYQTNSIIKEYIDNKCETCKIKLQTFNRVLDNALKSILPNIDPSSPTTHFELPFLLLERGSDIFNALDAPDIKADLKVFEPIDEEDWRREIAQSELDLKALINQEENKKTQRKNITKRGVSRFRRRRGGRRSKKRKKRKKRKTRKRRRKKI